MKKLNKEPFDKYREPDYKKKKIIRSLFQLLDTNETITLSNYGNKNELLPSNYSPSYNNDANNYFNKSIHYAIKNNIECILFLSQENHALDIEIAPSIHYIRHIYKEENSYLALLISRGNGLKKDAIIPHHWTIHYPISG